jgi:hypothetical protein
VGPFAALLWNSFSRTTMQWDLLSLRLAMAAVMLLSSVQAKFMLYFAL